MSFRTRLFLLVLILVLPVGLSAQSRRSLTVSGVVKEADTGEPIVAAGVMQKATNIGAITDLDGSYLIKVNDANGILVVSAIGYKSIEVCIRRIRSPPPLSVWAR